jgi:putative transposase
MRSFQVFIKTCKVEHKQFFLAKTDPDRFKSTMRIAGKSRDRVTRLNELWEIDASPSDVMTTDGRYSLYAVIDIYSRRMMVLITKTPRAEAMLLLIRRAILAWGVPERIRTDNGADFIAERSRRAFASLGIEHELCAPFSPEQKGVVERAIGTIQKSLMRVSPGFIGHNVAQRKQIEGRRAFERRLGEKVDKLFCVQSTAAQLQSDCDDWCARYYYHRKHSTLGISPFRAVAEFNGPIRQIEDERALDLLLADVADGGGLRVMGHQGVRVGGDLYIASGLMVGERVLVRHDPTDMGRIYCFTPDGETFLAEAICPETAGVGARDREHLAEFSGDGDADMLSRGIGVVLDEGFDECSNRAILGHVETGRPFPVALRRCREPHRLAVLDRCPPAAERGRTDAANRVANPTIKRQLPGVVGKAERLVRFNGGA